MKPTQIRAWPEMEDYFPSLSKLTDGASDKGNAASPPAAVMVDFSGVRRISSTGTTVFLLRLLRFMLKRPAPEIREECSPDVRASLVQLGAVDLIERLTGGVQHQLPLRDDSSHQQRFGNAAGIHFPIYHLEFNSSPNRRRVLNQFTRWVAVQLQQFEKEHSFQANGLAMILNEIAKNSADHSEQDGLFGADLLPAANGFSRLTFAFGDLGTGIKRHIEDHLPNALESRRAHMSLYEAYRLALSPGFTTQRASGVNKGFGMSIIVEAANAIDLHLSVFDAQSRGMLNIVESLEAPTHSAVRRIFHNIGHDVGFFYFGELLLRRRFL